MSFATETWSRSERCWLPNWFDAPAEHYMQGLITGYLMAGEFLAAVKKDGGLGLFDQVVEAAVAALREPAEGTSRRGAARGFLSILSALTTYAAREVRCDEYIATRVAEQQRLMIEIEQHRAKSRAESEQRQALARADFVQRMRAAKSAKVASASGGAQ